MGSSPAVLSITVLSPKPLLIFLVQGYHLKFVRLVLPGARDHCMYMYTVPPFPLLPVIFVPCHVVFIVSCIRLCVSSPGLKNAALLNFPMLISVLCIVLKASVRLLWLGTGSWCPQNLGTCRANEQLLFHYRESVLSHCSSTSFRCTNGDDEVFAFSSI